MATKSFFEDMVIDTDEAADRLIAAFDEADSGAPGIDTTGACKPIRDPEELGRILNWRSDTSTHLYTTSSKGMEKTD